MNLRLEKRGKRTYVKGDTFPIRRQISGAGAEWDGALKGWWFADYQKAAAFVKSLDGGGSELVDAKLEHDRRHVIGRVIYKTRECYLVAEGANERGRWVRLLFADGASTFFASAKHVTVTRRYPKPYEHAKLHDFALCRSRGNCGCGCHREPDAGNIGTILYSGCDRCGCIA